MGLTLSKQKRNVMIGSAIGAFVLNACWEWIVRDLFLFLGNSVASLISLFYKNYVDTLYENVCNGSSIFDAYPLVVLFAITVFIPFFAIYFFAIFKYLDSNEFEKDFNSETPSLFAKYINLLDTKKASGKIIAITAISFITILCTDMVMQKIVPLSVYNNLEKRILILKPYISQKSYDIFVSDLNRINNLKKFKDLNARINVEFKKNNINFEEYHPIGSNIK
ncbi:hypothetical protein [Pedobacter ureilyticus]|uniref:Uncharacterized protein n=1 Tax=Pedobacter ureilyticus TaxID=1393051 RepID=A0ABW9J1S7_9SPHI|nr:hypothetical protein [Pedobacter helvus]